MAGTAELSAAIPCQDEGLRCLRCGYNLTGLPRDICPECGVPVDWDAARTERDRERGLAATFWERWPWYLKPVGFVATMVQAALLPWMLARSLSSHPNVRWPVAYFAICLALAGGWLWAHEHLDNTFVAWLIGAIVCVLLQSLAMGLIAPIRPGGYSLRFWLAVSCYLGYPLVIEALWAAPAMLFSDGGTIWPFGEPNGYLPHDPITSVLFYLWWADLMVIFAVRTRRRQWWRLVPALLVTPAAALAASYAAMCVVLWQIL